MVGPAWSLDRISSAHHGRLAIITICPTQLDLVLVVRSSKGRQSKLGQTFANVVCKRCKRRKRLFRRLQTKRSFGNTMLGVTHVTHVTHVTSEETHVTHASQIEPNRCDSVYVGASMTEPVRNAMLFPLAAREIWFPTSSVQYHRGSQYSSEPRENRQICMGHCPV